VCKLFKEYTYNYLLNKMLSNVSDDIDKREGSVIYNAIAPCALELAENYKRLEGVINLVFIDTSSGEYLSNLTKQFGIARNGATCAIKKAMFYNSDNQLIDIEKGKRFSINGIIYSVLEKVETGIFQMKSETPGEIGNSQYGYLLPIDYIDGLSVAELSDILVPGEDEESDDELKERFYSSVNSVAFGGNIADYKEKVKEIDGVGAIKVIPTWNGGGTVKLVLLDSSYNAASETLILNVENVVGNNGDGIAPIGHIVTVVSAEGVSISVNTNLTIQEGFDVEVIKVAVEEAINNYFTEIKKEWEISSSLTIRIAHIESRILNVNGVVDIANTTINGSTSNLILTNEQIPLLGEVVINA